MKSILKSLSICLLLLSYSGVNGQSKNISISGIDMFSGYLTTDDGESSHSVPFNFAKCPTGHPDVFVISALFLIPNGTEVAIEVSSGSYEVYLEGYVKPVPPSVLEGSNEALPDESEYKDFAIYGSQEPYPGKFYEVKRLGKIRGQEVGIIYIYPFQYNPVEQVTYMYSNLSLQINYNGEVESLPQNLLSSFDPIQKKPIVYDPIQKKVINYDQVIELELDATLNLKSTSNFVEGCDHVIITHTQFLPAAQKLRDHRIARGMSSRIKTFGTGVTPADIEAYIDSCFFYMDPIPQYMLILGDVDFMPASDGIMGKTTDLPFFDVDDQAPRLPDFSSGRIPVKTLEEANVWIDKIISYENIGAGDPFFSNAGLISFFRPTYNGSGTEYFRYVKTVEELGTLFTFRNINFERLYYSDQSYIDKYTYIPAFLMSDDKLQTPIPGDIKLPNDYGFVWNKKNTEVIQGFNGNKFLMIHRGHGSTTGWGSDNVLQFSNTDVASLNNSEYPSVVWSLNCLTGKFDGSGDCISEKLGKHPTGGASGIVCATGETETIYNDHLLHGLAQAIWPEFMDLRRGNPINGLEYGYLRMGDILRNGLMHILNVGMNNGQVDPGAMNHILSYHWLGDPAMEIIPNLNCAPLRTIADVTIDNGQVAVYENAMEIQVQNSFIANPGSEVRIRAADRIVFGKGIVFKTGSKASAALEDCLISVAEYKNLQNPPINPNESVRGSVEQEKESGSTTMIYPNPTTGTLNIVGVDDWEDATIQIHNIKGQQLMSITMHDCNIRLNLSELAGGVYYIRVITKSQQVYREKFILQ